MRCYFLRGSHIVGVEMLPRGLSDPDAIARAYTLSAKRCGHRICGVAARLPHPEGCRRPLRWRMASRSFRERGISYEPLLAAQRPPSPAVFISWLLIQPFLSIERRIRYSRVRPESSHLVGGASCENGPNEARRWQTAPIHAYPECQSPTKLQRICASMALLPAKRTTESRVPGVTPVITARSLSTC